MKTDDGDSVAQDRSIKINLAVVITISNGEILGVGRISRVGILDYECHGGLCMKGVILRPRVTRDCFHGRKNGWISGGGFPPFAVFVHLQKE